MSNEKNKDILRTFQPDFCKNVRTSQAQKKSTGPYKIKKVYRVINPNCSNESSHCSKTTKDRKLGIVFDERVFTDICFLRGKLSKHAQ